MLSLCWCTRLFQSHGAPVWTGKDAGRWRAVHAHGPWVGLPSDDDMGNSEVGHNALGVRRVDAILLAI